MQVKWHCIRINDIIPNTHPVITILDNPDPNIGLTYQRIDDVLPFIRLPRSQALSIIGDSCLENIMIALEACERLRRTSLVRSDRKRIFGDNGQPVWYTCAGVQVSRNSREVLDSAPFLDKLQVNHWKELMRVMRWAENCFEYIGDHDVISHIRAAKALLEFKTMSIPSDDSSSAAKYFGGLAFGCNVFLRCHTDQDYDTMSIAHIHLKGKSKYEVNDEVVYFCFPTLGAAIPLCPGDFLMFNPRIPHCISSQCREADNVMCLSMYLKTSVVGLNNNLLELTEKQKVLAWRYHQLASTQLNFPH
jgi:hypothetical protein